MSYCGVPSLDDIKDGAAEAAVERATVREHTVCPVGWRDGVNADLNAEIVRQLTVLSVGHRRVRFKVAEIAIIRAGVRVRFKATPDDVAATIAEIDGAVLLASQLDTLGR